MSKRKFCPLTAAGGNIVGGCIKEECAWWCDFAKDCSVPLLAEMFADSEICRNVFGADQRMEMEP